MSGMTLPASYTTENDGIAERLANDNLVTLQGTLEVHTWAMGV